MRLVFSVTKGGAYEKPSLSAILICELIFPVHALPAVFNIASPDATASIQGEGAAYVTGPTGSVDFPITHPLQCTLGGTHDAFIAKLSTDGKAIVYGTYLGSHGLDRAKDDSSPPVSKLVANVMTLTNGNLLQNGDGGPSGVGNTLTIPKAGSFWDVVLSPGDSSTCRRIFV